MSSQHEPSPSRVRLKILRGRTRFPERPVESNRFLIGSGPHCDLRLGGADTPLLHSVLHFDGFTWWIDSVASTPRLQINDSTTRHSSIEPGDIVRIGAIEFVIQHDVHSEAVALEEPATIPIPSGPDELVEMPASKLIELIEHEEMLINLHDARLALGVEALLEAAADASSTVPGESERPAIIRMYPRELDDAKSVDAEASSAAPGELLALEQQLAQLSARIEELKGDPQRKAA